MRKVAGWLLLCLGIGALLLWGILRQPRQEPSVYLSGFFPSEQNERFSYQFSYPEASILVTMPPSSQAQLILQVSSPQPLPTRELTLRGVDDQSVGLLLDATPRVLRVLVATDSRTPGTLVQLNIPSASAKGDSRSLGAMVQQVRLIPLAIAVDPFAIWLPIVGVSFAGVGLLLLLNSIRSDRISLLRTVWLLFSSHVAVLSLATVACAYVAIIGYYSILNHQSYGTATYDMGLYDQILWLISRGLPAYSTGMGVHLLGNHAALILYPLAALYWIAPDVRALLIFQAVAIAAGTIPIYLMAKAHDSRAAGMIAGIVYLLHPATQNMGLNEFHPDALAATALLFALWAADRRRWSIMLLGCLVVLAAKENFALTVAWFGLWLVLRRDWRWGAPVMALSVAWFLLATCLIQPWYNGQGQPIHLELFRQYGQTFGDIAWTMVSNPLMVLRSLIQPDRLSYLLLLLAPFAFLPLLRPRFLFIALPALGLNLLSSLDYQRQLAFHYDALILACAVCALVESLCWLQQLGQHHLFPRMTIWSLFQHISSQRLLIVATLLMACGLWYTFQHSFLRIQAYPALRAERLERVPIYDYVLSQIPADVSISAPKMLQPHLTHRVQAYMFPNPFVWAAFYNPDASPLAHKVDYILYDTRRADNTSVPAAEKLQLLRDLQSSGRYRQILDIDGVILLQQIVAESSGEAS